VHTRVLHPGFAWGVACLLLLSAASAARAAGEYQTIEVESLRVTIDTEWGVRTTPGYLPVRFDITNLGEARVIEIAGEGMRYIRMSRTSATGRLAVRQTLRLARGDRVRLTIPVPIYADNENIWFEIRENDRSLQRLHHTWTQSKSAPDTAVVLLIADPSGALHPLASGWRRPISGSGTLAGRAGGAMRLEVAPGGPRGVMTPPPLDFILEPSRVPASWLGFTSLRAVVTGPREWEQLTEAQRSAILTWTACGGVLLFVDGALNVLFPAAAPPLVPSTSSTYAHYFGRIHLTSADAITQSGLAAAVSTASATHEPIWALPINRAAEWNTIAARGFRLPIPGVNGIPARAYLAILAVFSVLIGPANYWLLWRKRQQVLLVLTAPAISALFILLLAGYVLAGEGFGVRGRAVTFTMLDQARKSAATRASMSLYAAGMTPAGGLRFPRDLAVIPIGADGGGSRDSQVLDLTETQRFTSGLIRARTPTNVEQIGFRPARERLTFSRDAAGISVVNGLDATVTTLIYRDGDALYSLGRPLPAGGRDVLQRGGRRAVDIVPKDLFPSAVARLFDRPPDGAYLAVLDRSPFWNPGVENLDERASFHVVLGWPEGQR
jgi:hypothetical protein